MTTLQISVIVMAQERNTLTVINIFSLNTLLLVHWYCKHAFELIMTVAVLYACISQGSITAISLSNEHTLFNEGYVYREKQG